MKIFGLIPLFLGVAAEAQQVQPCFEGQNIPYQVSAAAIAEPWEANTRSFADGDIRITVMDTWEPALGAYYLMVMFWAGADADIRNCSLVSNAELGFVSMTLEGLVSKYDPAKGLVLSVPTSFHNPAEGTNENGMLEVVVNRQKAEVTATRR
ncbi:MAG: hypothetical protein GQ535_12045 [Rhodobacteraceae bacterium]|nr:hypothetical protein [Paracoccaceae bacterium]